MPSFRRRASVVDADPVEEAPQVSDGSVGEADALSLAEQAEAEAAEAEALAAAARARARAIRLRREAQEQEETAETEAADTVATDAADADVDETAEETADEDVIEEPAASRRRLRMPRIRWKIVAGVLAVLLTLAFAAASGYMVWQHRLTQQEQQTRAEFAAAGRQAVVTLMSLDFNHAKEDVQRIIDNSTGQFKTDFETQAADFVKVAQDSKVVTEVTVNSVAVDSMSDDQAVVLVAASSRVTNDAGAKQEPRSWRLSVNLQRENGQIKMSKVEFVP